MSIQIPATASTPSISSQAIALASRDLRQQPQEQTDRPQVSARRAGSAVVRQTRVEAVQRQQDRLSERVDKLVQNMKAVAERISSQQTSITQRSVLVGRFNDLRRQVDELDGIVVSEGRTAQGEGQVSTATLAGRNPQRTASSLAQPSRARQAAPLAAAFQQPTAGAGAVPARGRAENLAPTAAARAPQLAPARRELVRQRFTIGIAGQSASRAVDLVV